MPPPLKIIYANRETAAFTVASELFYIKIGPDLPELYDKNLKRQIVPNVDYWFQAKTHQRYSFRGICDMIGAFVDGIEHSYSRNDLTGICEIVFTKTVAYIFKTNHTRSFARSYWIEILEERQVKKLVTKISNDFEQFHEKYGTDKFHDYLCRLWQFYNFYAPGEAPVVERLISRLGKTPTEPRYPVVEVEQTIKEYILTDDLIRNIDRHKSVEQDIRQNVDRIQTGRLPGA